MIETSRATARIVFFLRIVAGGLLTFLFPEAVTKYRPEDHYMRGPGPKWRAKHLVDRKPGGA
jgi:hypothetical protein